MTLSNLKQDADWAKYLQPRVLGALGVFKVPRTVIVHVVFSKIKPTLSLLLSPLLHVVTIEQNKTTYDHYLGSLHASIRDTVRALLRTFSRYIRYDLVKNVLYFKFIFIQQSNVTYLFVRMGTEAYLVFL